MYRSILTAIDNTLSAELDAHGQARRIVDEAVARLRAPGVAAGGYVAGGTHAEVPDLLLEEARRLDSDLVVLGPHHHGRLSILLGGSVSEDVVRHVP